MCQYIPTMQDQWTDLIGDKDPVDVCEIGSLPRPSGTVLPVRFDPRDKNHSSWIDISVDCCLLGLVSMIKITPCELI